MRISDWSSDVCSSDLIASVLANPGLDRIDMAREAAFRPGIRLDGHGGAHMQLGKILLRHGKIDEKPVERRQRGDGIDRIEILAQIDATDAEFASEGRTDLLLGDARVEMLRSEEHKSELQSHMSY